MRNTLSTILPALVFAAFVSNAAGASTAAITNFSQLAALSEKEARVGAPVSLMAWVVAMEAGGSVFLRDATGGFECRKIKQAADLRAGQRVRLEAGTTWSAGRIDLRVNELALVEATPEPRRLDFGERVASAEVMEWVQAEGVVTFAGTSGKTLVLDVAERGRHLAVQVFPSPSLDVSALLHRKVRFCGVAQAGINPAGELTLGRSWVDGLGAIHLAEPTIQDWSAAVPVTAAQLESTVTPGTLVRLGGKLATNSTARFGEFLDAEGGVVRVDLTPEVSFKFGDSFELLGIAALLESRPTVFCGYFKPMITGSNALPLLTTVEQIHRLKPEEAGRGYPVLIRGIATGGYGYIQDATRGISVSNAMGRLEFGASYQIEGITGSGFYAPVIQQAKLTYLGPGQLPEPIHPTWAYLASGSAVCQWLELQGLLLSVSNNWVTLAIPGGRVEAEIQGGTESNLSALVNGIVRIRGTCRSEYNARRQITRFWISVPSPAFISEEVPTRGDPFDAVMRSITEIQQFDVDAYQIRRLKVGGQVTYHTKSVGYLTDGTNHLRYSLQAPAPLLPGDNLELVGFPDAGDFSTVLRESIWRKTSQAALPSAELRTYEELSSGEFNSARVRVKGRVLAVNAVASETVLTLLVQSNAVTAHVQTPVELFGASLQVGSVIEATGICAARPTRSDAPGEGNAFELLVQSSAEVNVLERPSWWNFRHSLAVVSVLGTVLMLALGWIHLLRSKVAERTRQLQAQMAETERVERKRALEQERSRIARDLHDNLGSCLTEISMLAETGQRAPVANEDPRQRFGQILGRAHTLVHTLDETVWAVDPAKDNLPSLVRYLAGFAEEFTASAGVSCRIEVPANVPELALTADVRHDLFLATKEAIHNAVRHADAKEITFQLQLNAGELEIRVADDGRGFDAALPSSGDGLGNLRQRMNLPGRRCEITTHPGAGTTVLLAVTLPVGKTSAPV